MKQLIFILLLFSLNLSAEPDNKLRISIDKFINNFTDSLEKTGINKCVSVIEIEHIDQNESENFGFIFWDDSNSNKYVSIYITNNCSKNVKRCNLIGIRAEYRYLLIKPELNLPFEYFNVFRGELQNAELALLKDSLGNELIPFPYCSQKIRIKTEFGQLIKTVEEYKFYSRKDIASNEYLKNTESKLFPLYLMIESLKNETIIQGEKIKLLKLRLK